MSNVRVFFQIWKAKVDINDNQATKQFIIKVSAFCVFTALNMNLALAQSSILSCVQIEAPSARLECFDQAAADLSAIENNSNPVVLNSNNINSSLEIVEVEALAPADVVAQEPVVQIATVVVEPAAPVEIIPFGLAAQEVDTLGNSRTYTVVRARRSDYNGWTIEFDEGGIWRQIGTDSYRINVGESYTIQRASFDSFQLGNANNSRKIRVTRLE